MTFLSELKRLREAATKGPFKTGYMESHAFLINHAEAIEKLVIATDTFLKDPRNNTMLALYNALAKLEKP